MFYVSAGKPAPRFALVLDSSRKNSLGFNYVVFVPHVQHTEAIWTSKYSQHFQKNHFCIQWAFDFVLHNSDSPTSTSGWFVSIDCGILMLTAGLLADIEVVWIQLNSCWLTLQVSVLGVKKQNTPVEGLFIKNQKVLLWGAAPSLWPLSVCITPDLRTLIVSASLETVW